MHSDTKRTHSRLVKVKVKADIKANINYAIVIINLYKTQQTVERTQYKHTVTKFNDKGGN